MATMVSRVNDLALAVRNKFNLVTPRLPAAGGRTGQVWAKASAADNDAAWTTPLYEGLICGRVGTSRGDDALYTPNTTARLGPYQLGAILKRRPQSFGGASVYALRLAWTNWYQFPGELDAPAGAALTLIGASIVPTFGAATMPVQVLFGGASSATIAPGQTVWSDWMAAKLPSTSDFEIRQTVSWTSSGSLYSTHHLLNGLGEYIEGGTTVTDRTMAKVAGGGYSHSYDSSGQAWGPSAIMGRVRAPTAGAYGVGIVGDSITLGTGDGAGDAYGNQGWAERLCYNAGVGWLNASMSSKKSSDYIANSKRVMGLLGGAGATHAIYELNVNDTDTTLAPMQAKAQEAWARFAAQGIRPIATTTTTETTSSDSWATTTNQTAGNSRWNVGGVVSQFNDWLRAGAGGDANLAGVLDVADLTMSARNSMKWRVDLGSPTADGIHPSAVLHNAIDVGLRTPLATILAAA